MKMSTPPTIIMGIPMMMPMSVKQQIVPRIINISPMAFRRGLIDNATKTATTPKTIAMKCG